MLLKWVLPVLNTAYVAEGADLAEGADRANGADVTDVANLAKIGNLALHKNTLFYFDCFCHQEFKNISSDGLYTAFTA